MRKVCLSTSIFAFILASSSFARDRDPSGERASYQLDRSRARTSVLVKKGKFAVSIGELVNDAYRTSIDYELSILFGGDYKGTEVTSIAKEFFAPVFMERLRAEKEIIGDTYKIKYLGQTDMKTAQGRVYPKCDKLLIYDIDVQQNALGDMVKTLLIPPVRAEHPELFETPGGDVKDAKLLVHLHVNVPALNVVKLDVAGTVQGFQAKAGFDYQK